jgi:hypothetical protein
MKRKILNIYKYSDKFYRVNFNDKTGFLFSRKELNKWNLIIDYIKKIDNKK